MTDAERCPCGEPLHYASPESKAVVMDLIRRLGVYQKITVTGVGTWMVPRHYIALHGLKGWAVAVLAKQYGWECVELVIQPSQGVNADDDPLGLR